MSHPVARACCELLSSVVMAKENRENVWLQCTSCNDLNYRTEIKVAGGPQKIELNKFCRRERSHKLHKVKRK